jgi:hypothetical protein
MQQGAFSIHISYRIVLSRTFLPQGTGNKENTNDMKNKHINCENCDCFVIALRISKLLSIYKWCESFEKF